MKTSNIVKRQTSKDTKGMACYRNVLSPVSVFSRRILEKNEPDYYSGKFFFFFFRQTTECMRSGHFSQNY